MKRSAGEYMCGDAFTNTVGGLLERVQARRDWQLSVLLKRAFAALLVRVGFRYDNRSAPEINDRMRADRLLEDIVGKQLTYQSAPGKAANENDGESDEKA